MDAVQSLDGGLLLRPPGGDHPRYSKVLDGDAELRLADRVDERVEAGGGLTENPCEMGGRLDVGRFIYMVFTSPLF